MLTKVLIVLSLKFILSVYPVKRRGTYEGGEGQPADFISNEHGIPRSRLILGMPKKELALTGEKMCTRVRTQIIQVWQNSPNFRAINEPVGTMGSVKTASKPCRVKRCREKIGERGEY